MGDIKKRDLDAMRVTAAIDTWRSAQHAVAALGIGGAVQAEIARRLDDLTPENIGDEASTAPLLRLLHALQSVADAMRDATPSMPGENASPERGAVLSRGRGRRRIYRSGPANVGGFRNGGAHSETASFLLAQCIMQFDGGAR